MANKKVSELPIITSLRDDDIIVMNQLGTTGTASLSDIGNKVTSNYIPKPPTTAADDRKFLTYQHSTQSWVANSIREVVKYPVTDHFVLSERPNESNLTNATNNDYANNTWRDIKTLTKKPWTDYFGTRNPKTITIVVHTGEAEVIATVGNPITFSNISNIANGDYTINSEQYICERLNVSGNDQNESSVNKIWLNDSGTFYIKIRRTNPNTFTCRIYLIEAEF
jgi:hypothetical protein